MKHMTPRLETALGHELKKLLPGAKLRREKNKDVRNPMPSPMESGEDGVDHINIWDQGATDLGKLLAHRTELSFTHSVFGRFISMEAFWHYIRSEERDDRIRTMDPKNMKRFLEKLTTVRVPNFKAIIMDANWQKIRQYPALLKALKESDLPIECYYTYKRSDGVRIRPGFGFWVIQGFTEIRQALKEERQPDFSSLMDKKNIGLYDGVLMSVKPKTPESKPVAEFTDENKKELSALLQSANLTDPALDQDTDADALPEMTEVHSEVSSSEQLQPAA